ncbi:MAG: RNA polymerase sporulation sigma factor SigK [Oscillospiraceae bacterium]|nr:RNA polymerase sporulation sigma factor SigK [Oscillospiraceae bacterium]
MIESAFWLLMNSLLLMLRVMPGDSFPKPLSRMEEEEYLERWEKGDIEARNKLVEHNLRLVAHIIKKYYTQTEDTDDLISIGTIGLIKGINTYRRDRGVRLTSYASRCIENEILMFFRSRRKSAGDVSLSDAIETDDDSGGLSLFDVVSEEQDLSERVCEKELCQQLRREMERTLDERERRILTLRYGLDGEKTHTQHETAELCAISRSYVSRLEKHALEKLRRALEA